MRNKELTPLSGEERLKYEVARELGLMDKLLDVGWPGLTAGETGRIGGRREHDANRCGQC